MDYKLVFYLFITINKPITKDLIRRVSCYLASQVVVQSA